jgi:two-component sensor histidine kinase
MSTQPELILNVNDDEPGRYATGRLLSRAGFRVVEAATGEDALRIAREQQPALVVLDINLPGISGIEVCKRLKTDAETAGIMVLQVSATNIGVTDRVLSLSAGADSFLVEPFEAEELEAVARALVRLHRTENALRRALVERELLLKEVNHRVKNSLQLVLSMLSLQGQEFRQAGARELFAKAIARVTAIASIHERLYQDNDPLTVEMQSYLTGLCNELGRAGIGEGRDALLQSDIESLRLPAEHGVAVALIVNELVMNALKHGRPTDGAAAINVRLSRHGEHDVRLSVTDNGAGRDPATAAEHSGLGTRLISMLVHQLNGQLKVEDSTTGYAAHVTFPMHAPTAWRPQS